MRSAPSIDDLFDALDQDADEQLSRADLHAAAIALRWRWNEAPLYALLDRLTLAAPLSRAAFSERLTEVLEDHRGPYGRVLNACPPPPTPPAAPGADAATRTTPARAEEVEAASAALLIIDPQRSFTSGSWMRSMGPDGSAQVAPIRAAFRRCGELLARRPVDAVMFTRCPFPPDSYDWDERVTGQIGAAQPYFVKPGNSALWPPTNGFARWVESLLGCGRATLVVGGCTLNSCVRVTVVETLQRFAAAGLTVAVDLSLCGARAGNHQPSLEFGGQSSVQAAVEEMTRSGALVVSRVRWR